MLSNNRFTCFNRYRRQSENWSREAATKLLRVIILSGNNLTETK
ncbi:hypothetical protein OTSUT76_4180 [Orientia tsutsugamushi str. UT76]|nr:hypothetical protein OTSUT76_4180 [Orientia tsutsugamushi str. UT76]